MKFKLTLRPEDAWKPIGKSAWTEDNIRHLLRRASWTARPADVRKLVAIGPEKATDYLFKQANYPEHHPVVDAFPDHIDKELGSEIDQAISWARNNKKWSSRIAKIKTQSYRDPHARAIIVAHHNYQRNEARENNKKNKFDKQFRDRFGQGDMWNKYAHKWFDIANQPRNSPVEKLNQFLQNVLVVNYRTLASSSDDAVADLHNHHRVIRNNLFGSYPDMCKKMFKGRGMGYMLDIIGSTKARPNENFARELMELFTMGVDNGYDEEDIKEAARAFTGYVINPDVSPYSIKKGESELILDESRHDDTRKRVLKRSSKMDGDEIIDTIFRRPECETYLPHMLSHHCLIDGGLPEEYLKPLGESWRDAKFNVYWLIETFFRSKIFYDPVFRGQIYKSPFQFYLGLLQDLGLQVQPSHEILREMDYLGQPFANPPDVNGWNGAAFWMNNGTINARRIMVERLFSGSYRRGSKVTSAGAANYVVTDELIRLFIDTGDRTDEETVDHFVTYLLAVPPVEKYRNLLYEHYRKKSNKVAALREIILTILQSPYYQVC